MRRAFTRLFGMGALILTLGGMDAHAGCVNWKEAGNLIKQNSLVSGKDVYDRIKQKSQSQIITASLCQEDGRFVYRIVLLSPAGKVTNVSVDARTGQF